MNTEKTLFSTLNVLIFLILLAIGFGLIFSILSMTGVIGVTPSITINGHEIGHNDLTVAHYIFMGLNLIFYGVFIFGLFKLRVVAKLILQNDIYNPSLSINSELAGKDFVLTGTFWWLFDGLSNLHFNNKLSIGVSDKTFVYLFIICIGLFLMLTSKLITNAIQLKAENDLTI